MVEAKNKDEGKPLTDKDLAGASGGILAQNTLAEIVAPLEVSQFLGEHYRIRPAVLRGSADRARGLVSLRAIVDMVSGAGVPAGRLIADGDALRSATAPSADFAAAIDGGMTPGTERTWGYLEAGRVLVWNSARGATPALDRLCAEMGAALGAAVWPNVYVTGSAGPPIVAHFDCHEVIAIQCEGQKQWTVSATRVSEPLEGASFKEEHYRTAAALREEAALCPEIVATLQPGDVIYVPRGQFHQARAVDGISVHVTLGIEHLTGMTVMEVLAQAAAADPRFRASLPSAATDPDRARMRARLIELSEALSAMVRTEDLVGTMVKLEGQLAGCGARRDTEKPAA